MFVFIEFCKNIDVRLFLWINGMHNAFLDHIMIWVSEPLYWLPLYLIITYILIKKYRLQSIGIFVAVALCVLISDQTASHLLKPLVHRLRPSHCLTLAHIIHLPNGCGGTYGFVSSHAANCFSLTTLFYLIFNKSLNWLKYTLVCVSVIVSYSRVYLGVHYPADVIAAALLGIIVGYIVSILYKLVENRIVWVTDR